MIYVGHRPEEKENNGLNSNILQTVQHPAHGTSIHQQIQKIVFVVNPLRSPTDSSKYSLKFYHVTQVTFQTKETCCCNFNTNKNK